MWRSSSASLTRAISPRCSAGLSARRRADTAPISSGLASSRRPSSERPATKLGRSDQSSVLQTSGQALPDVQSPLRCAMDLEALQDVALAGAGERSLETVLTHIVEGLRR